MRALVFFDYIQHDSSTVIFFFNYYYSPVQDDNHHSRRMVQNSLTFSIYYDINILFLMECWSGEKAFNY